MKGLLIHNTASGHGEHTEEIHQALSILWAAGWSVDLAKTSEVDGISRLSRLAVESNAEVVVVAGGDGSINVAVQELANSNTALGVLPVGTANMWAREIGIPLDVRRAAKALPAGQVVPIDLGNANGRYFLGVAGVGFDGAVARAVDSRHKRRLGMGAYVAAAASQALTLSPEVVAITIDGLGIRRNMLMAVACNVRHYGGILRMAPKALADDGLLDLWIFRGEGLWQGMVHASNILTGHPGRSPDADFHRCSAVRIESSNPIPVQLDGDYFGTTPVTIHVAPAALKAIVPPGPQPSLSKGGSGF